MERPKKRQNCLKLSGSSAKNLQFFSAAFKITPEGVITEIIDASGDGAGNNLGFPGGIAVDSAGNVYVAGFSSDNVFKVTPDGAITKIIDANGDGTGNNLDGPSDIAVDSGGTVYVSGSSSNNAFKIEPIIESIPLAAGWNLISTSQLSLMVVNPSTQGRIWTWNAPQQRFEALANGNRDD